MSHLLLFSCHVNVLFFPLFLKKLPNRYVFVQFYSSEFSAAILSGKLAFFTSTLISTTSLRLYEIHARKTRSRCDPQDIFIFVYCVYIQIYLKVNVMSFITPDGSFSNHFADAVYTLEKPTFLRLLISSMSVEGVAKRCAKKGPWTPTFNTELLHIFQAFFKRHSQ